MDHTYLPNRGSCYYHLSCSHNRKGTATCGIHDLCGVTEAEEAEQKFEVGTVGSKVRAHDHRAMMPPPATLQALLPSHQFLCVCHTCCQPGCGNENMKPPLSQHKPWSDELGEPLCKEQDGFFYGRVSALSGHMGFQPTQSLVADEV